MDKYQETFLTWDQVALAYQEKFMDLSLYNHTYDAFIRFLPQKASVLDVGCGPGNITRYLLEKNPNHQLLGIDVSPKMVALAAKNNPTADFEVMDCRDISLLSQKFEGIIAGFCIPYLSKTDCQHFFKACADLLQPKGVFYLSFVPGNPKNSGFISNKQGSRVYFNYHTLAFIKEEMENRGLEIKKSDYINYDKGNQTSETHVVLMAQKI
ncbi:trans-aconitate 2-methyltransferase [Mesonia sp. K7]|uniref:class I SAM-dependent methyltransferase n=1 Tax=Mesonia sp. K7 TaxID=2218606 RepID=UPI000DAA4B8F|nr:class I SAM-dependent methyltransferase [Mesonia sp. K7]PZD79504.1 class I SAM-dependent methyltransferase [Mesonia sp. K7]